MAGKSVRRREAGDVVKTGGGPVVDRAVARVGWWLPETVVAAALAGLVLWAGIGWLVWPIAAGLGVRIGWQWPLTRRVVRVVGGIGRELMRRWRRRRAGRRPVPRGATSTAAERTRDEVAS
jgi:alpha-beta hydrolase superfamily lysophospholipase